MLFKGCKNPVNETQVQKKYFKNRSILKNLFFQKNSNFKIRSKNRPTGVYLHNNRYLLKIIFITLYQPV